MVSVTATWKFFRRKPVTIFCGALLFAIWCLYFFVQQARDSDRDSVELPPSSVLPENPEPDEEPSPAILPPDIEIEEPPHDLVLHIFDDTAIRDLCANAPWDSGTDLVIGCEGRVGGIGNVRQEVLQCVRLAIEVGAGLIRPSMRIRSEGLIEYQLGPLIGFDYFFDTSSFEGRLRSACPRMPLFQDFEAVETLGKVSRVGRPWDLPDDENGNQISFAEWVEENRVPEAEITVIDLPLTMGQGQVCEDGAAFVNNFGGLVDFRTDAQMLVLNALFELTQRFGGARLLSPGLNDSPFIGVHLRTAVDAINAGYANYETQASEYLDIISSRSPAVVYAASGNDTSLDQFTQDAAALPRPVPVVTKRHLLSIEDLEILDSLTWDQQAIVDFLILQKGSYFAGITESSFAWGIAYARQVISQNGTCVDEMDTLPEGILYEDEYSIVFGEDRDFFWGKVWP